MKTRLIRALIAALVAGTVILAGTAAAGPPGTNKSGMQPLVVLG